MVDLWSNLRLTGGVLGSMLGDLAIAEGSFGEKDDVAIFQELERLGLAVDSCKDAKADRLPLAQ